MVVLLVSPAILDKVMLCCKMIWMIGEEQLGCEGNEEDTGWRCEWERLEVGGVGRLEESELKWKMRGENY